MDVYSITVNLIIAKRHSITVCMLKDTFTLLSTNVLKLILLVGDSYRMCRNVIKVKWVIFSCQVIYEVTVVTGDVQNAGTDTLIYMSVFGANGSTEEMLLQKNEDR